MRADGTGPAGTPDGVIDHLDHDLWKDHFGDALPTRAGGQSSASVPEPSAVLLAYIAMVGRLLCASDRGVVFGR